MTRKWLVSSSLIILLILTWVWRKGAPFKPAQKIQQPVSETFNEPVWVAPDISRIPADSMGELIRYGRNLISFTAQYFGPNGTISHRSNGMNCQNCHLKAGTQPWAGNFGAVASVYPRFSERKGSPETVNHRITDCFERSMNGQAPDSTSKEMRAMNAYLLWLGRDVKKGKRPRGTGLEVLPFLNRPADSSRGRLVYITKCQQCHGANGNGQTNPGSGYLYPPLWGPHSYNTSAGLYRLSKFAAFVKDNMPYGSDYTNEKLSLEEAWDLAAFVNSQPRPHKKFKQDWPDILLKPVDLEEGPFIDTLSARQHKYGPYAPIAKIKKEMSEKKSVRQLATN